MNAIPLGGDAYAARSAVLHAHDHVELRRGEGVIRAAGRVLSLQVVGQADDSRIGREQVFEPGEATRSSRPGSTAIRSIASATSSRRWAVPRPPLIVMMIPWCWAVVGTTAALQLGVKQDFGLAVAMGLSVGGDYHRGQATSSILNSIVVTSNLMQGKLPSGSSHVISTKVGTRIPENSR